MRCRVCGEQLVFVRDFYGGPRLSTRAFHSGINLCDHDIFSAYARLVEPPLPTQRRLRRELEKDCIPAPY